MARRFGSTLPRQGGTADIAAALRAHHVDVLHIASSGVELHDGRQYIALGDPNSTDPMAVVVLVSAAELLGLLGATAWPRLVVLAGSDTEVLAAELARRIPAVVGLRAAVSDEECDPFLRDFYPALGAAESIEHAMSAGRARQRAVTSALGTDWAAPVGYFAGTQRLVAPDVRAASPDVAPAPSRRTVVLTGTTSADRAGLELEISTLNLQAVLKQWSPVDERLWPDLVTHRRDVLQAKIADATLGAMSASEAARSHPDTRPEGQLLPRVVLAYRLLEERRSVADRLGSLINRLAEPNLLAVAGERWLLDQLNGQLASARAALDEVVAGTTTVGVAAVERLEQPLNGAEWSVAADTMTSVEQRCLEQDAVVRALTEDLDTYRLWFDRYRRELTLAIDAGVPVSAEDREMLTEGGARMREADSGAKRGRFDTVAVALKEMRTALEKRELWDAAAFEGRINEIADRRVEVEQRAAVMANRSELILIAASHTRAGVASSAPASAQIEYGVLLRRPSFEAAQESNLHETMRIDADDRRQFQATLDEVAKAAVAGVRSAADLVAAPATASGEPTRGITSAARRAVDEHPEERLERIGRLMYSLLIPDAMQRLLDETPCPLTVSSNDLELPWELMHDGNDFLCLKRPFARMPVGKTYPRRTRRMVPSTRTTWNMLLIHSDPDGNLADSATEIAEIQTTLNQLPPPVQVKATILDGDQATGENLTRHLSSGHYDLVHYAGHAGFDLARPDQSFLLLHGRQRFSAERIQRVLEGRPIIFLNACDTSRTNNESDTDSASGTVAQAQGLASAFIYGGAQACVGALWPIFDDSARALAVSFYTGLLARQPVGEALCNARELSRTKHSDRLTWAAYALYGDPRYRLREGAPASHVPAIIDTT